jgi:large subunit ribosomal protein L24
MVRYMNSLNAYKHIRDKAVSSNLANNLREQYGRRSMRVIKGDTIKVLRGEYSGIEGKVEKVNTKRATLAIEGVQREKIRGGNVKVPIHASNVQIVALKLGDVFRQKKIERSKQKDRATGVRTGNKKNVKAADNGNLNIENKDDSKPKARSQSKRKSTAGKETE